MRYIVIEGNEDNALYITKCTKEESCKIIDERFDDQDYLGLYKFNPHDYHALVITDDENLIAKYRNVLSVEEFLEKYDPLINVDIKTYFTLVWIGEIEFARGFHGSDHYTDESGQSWTSSPHFSWRTKKETGSEI